MINLKGNILRVMHVRGLLKSQVTKNTLVSEKINDYEHNELNDVKNRVKNSVLWRTKEAYLLTKTHLINTGNDVFHIKVDRFIINV